MSALASILAAVGLYGPSPGTKVTAGSTSTAAQNLSTLKGQTVLFWLSEPAHIRFGDSAVGAATTSDVVFPKETAIPVKIRDGKAYFRAIRQGSTDADIHYGSAD